MARKTVAERFNEKLFPLENGCIGLDVFHTQNRPKMYANGRYVKGSHVALNLRGIEVPRGQMVCHHCDNPACVNADHLFVGTSLDNVLDCMSKGRHAHGEQHSISILNEAAVRDIRENCLLRGQPKIFMAKYGISNSTITNVKKRKTWKHIK